MLCFFQYNIHSSIYFETLLEAVGFMRQDLTYIEISQDVSIDIPVIADLETSLFYREDCISVLDLYFFY